MSEVLLHVAMLKRTARCDIDGLGHKLQADAAIKALFVLKNGVLRWKGVCVDGQFPALDVVSLKWCCHL